MSDQSQQQFKIHPAIQQPMMSPKDSMRELVKLFMRQATSEALQAYS